MKKLIIFDLDGTLALSKSAMDVEMAQLLVGLLKNDKMVAIISGGKYSQFEKQILPVIGKVGAEAGITLENLFLFPTCGAAFYRFDNKNWALVYAENLLVQEKNKIKAAFDVALASKLNYQHPEKIYGEMLEDRGTQMTFSALGQEAPLELKEKWDPNSAKRLRIIMALAPMLGEFDLAVGGTTSIDVLHKGINKAYGIKKMEEHLGVAKKDMLFMGDKVFPGGNDYAAKEAGVDCILVKDPEETKKQIARILREC